MMLLPRTSYALLLVAWAGCATPTDSSTSQESAIDRQPGLHRREFIFERAPFPSAHASTLAETPAGLRAAWFAGKDEGEPDVGIWFSRHENGGWLPPLEVANGLQADGRTRHPCWNPVLHQEPGGPLLLFYKVGPRPTRWWGMLISSTNHGLTWSAPRRLPDGILGPVRAKPVRLEDGTLLCGSSTEDQEESGWRIHLETTRDLGATWSRSASLNSPAAFSVIQPTILLWDAQRIQLLCRSKHERIVECWSHDGGRTWASPRATILPNPSAGIDAVRLQDGRALLIYNHTTRADNPFDGREFLNLAVSKDGSTWQAALVIEDSPGEYSYPAMIQTRDGLVHLTYTWKRQRIKHAIIDPRLIVPQDMPEGRWPRPIANSR